MSSLTGPPDRAADAETPGCYRTYFRDHGSQPQKKGRSNERPFQTLSALRLRQELR
jgi:hypothetical protein